MAEPIVGEYLELPTALGHIESPDRNLFLSLEIDPYPNCSVILIIIFIQINWKIGNLRIIRGKP
ncbi:MAG: hypothetical protein ACTSRC_01305 [Candidatus Helarchaeota archaeon]